MATEFDKDPTFPSEAQMNSFMTYLILHSKKLREDAGYAGEHWDGGSRALLDTVDAYKAGKAGLIPPCWRDLWSTYTRNQDPEYQEFLRLRKKFKE